MKNQTPTKTVIEMPIEQFEELIREIHIISEKIEWISQFDLVESTRITANEFAERVEISKSKLRRLINGSHPSGFVLKSFKKTSTKTVWTLANEVERYFEGFGFYSRIPSYGNSKKHDFGLSEID